MTTALPAGAVTFLFTDIEGSTPLWERDRSGMRSAVAVHDELMREAVEGHAGTIFKTGGDSVCAAFAVPGDAFAAAMEAQASLIAEQWPTDEPLRVRMGLHTGTAQLRDGDYFGPTLNRVARVMESGHGGQILVSAAAHRLLVDDLPEGVGLSLLGTYHLRGLDRPEDVFQVVAPGLPSEFGPLRTVSRVEDAAGRAEAAYEAKEWQAAVADLDALEARGPLSAQQHLMYAHSLWWLGRHDDLATRFESAFRTAQADGDAEAAVTAAIELAEINHHLLAPEVSGTWERRAEKLLDALGESPVLGHFLRWRTVRAMEVDGDLDQALDLTEKVMEIAKHHGDGDLETLALQDRGRILVALGRPDEGMPLMDEAMLAAVAGDVNPMVVGRSYCNMLAVCDQTGDIRRASEWSAAAERWCEQSGQAPYPGVCRIFKAEIMWQKGAWVEAESEVLRASGELGMLSDVVGEAFYQYGEMRLRSGDRKAAQVAFQEALARGRHPVPGYAVLLAWNGDPAAALEIMERTLADLARGRLERSKLLPVLVDLLIAQDRLDEADEAADELSQMAAVTRSELFEGRAAHSKGRILAARGDFKGAIDRLRAALTSFTRIGLPFEMALVHADLGVAYRSDGAEAMATMELSVASSELAKLGAGPDLERVAALVGERS